MTAPTSTQATPGAYFDDDTLVVAIGGNLGSQAQITERFASAMGSLSELFGPARCAQLYQSRALGPVASQPRFLNTAAIFHIKVDCPETILEHLLAVEKEHGRERLVFQGPRSLDLDLIFHGSRCLDSQNLKLPHPRWKERRFVLEPLRDLLSENFIWRGSSSALPKCADETSSDGKEAQFAQTCSEVLSLQELLDTREISAQDCVCLGSWYSV